MLVGHCSFDSPDAALLVSLLPQLLHVRGEHRLALQQRLRISYMPFPSINHDEKVILGA